MGIKLFFSPYSVDYIEKSSVNIMCPLHNAEYHRHVNMAERAEYSSVIKRYSNQIDPRHWYLQEQ